MAKGHPGGSRDVSKLEGHRQWNWWCYGSSLWRSSGRFLGGAGVVTRTGEEGQAYHATQQPAERHGAALWCHTPCPSSRVLRLLAQPHFFIRASVEEMGNQAKTGFCHT